jgi:hypothetical protein
MNSIQLLTRILLSRPDIWYPANAFAGWCMLIAEVICVAVLWLLPARAFVRPWLPIALFCLAPILSLVVSLIHLQQFR